MLREGETFRFPRASRTHWNASPVEEWCRSTAARTRQRLSDFVVENGGTLGRGDPAAYAAIERPPVRARFRGTEVLTNSSNT